MDKMKFPCAVKARDLQLADTVQTNDVSLFSFAVVTKIENREIHLFRPYATTADFSYTGGVIPYIGIETYSIPANDLTVTLWSSKGTQMTTTEHTPGRLSDPQAIRTFMLAGNATLTLVSRATEARFTYKITVPDDAKEGHAPLYFVALLNGPDNETSFQYLGIIRNGAFSHGRKSKVMADAPSVRAFTWFMQRLYAGQLPASLEVWHEGRCGRCARKLTVPSSIASGFGPECVKYMACEAA